MVGLDLVAGGEVAGGVGEEEEGGAGGGAVRGMGDVRAGGVEGDYFLDIVSGVEGELGRGWGLTPAGLVFGGRGGAERQ